MEEKTLETVAAIVDAITQSDEWNAIGSSDPSIVRASRRFSETLDGLTFDQIGEISAANGLCVSAHTDAAILYGIRVAFALLEIIKAPDALSLHYVKRMERHEGH